MKEVETESAVTRRRELGQFLRHRRQELAPEDAGILTRRNRRTPGLRREEVAFLADIGVKWYARLEAGEMANPSTATLLGIVRALQPKPEEAHYLFRLANVAEPWLLSDDIGGPVPPVFDVFLPTVQGVSAVLSDWYLTPLRWNAVADGIFGHSRYPSPLERSPLVRGIFEPDYPAMFGADFEALRRTVVGIFRRAYMAREPTQLARDIFERVKDQPLFASAWNERVVAERVTNNDGFVRHHPLVGEMRLYPLDLVVPHRADLQLRILFPADEATGEKLVRVGALGRAWSPDLIE